MLSTRIFFFVAILTATLGAFGQKTSNWSEALEGKINKALYAIYETNDFQFTQQNQLAGNSIEGVNLESNLYKVFVADELKGYIYVSKAPSMKNVFDYLVLFNKNLSIEKAKVLIYREQHGRQIGTARWLSQFKGLETEDRPVLSENIDGISGATISATSMTKAINNLLKALDIVKIQGLL